MMNSPLMVVEDDLGFRDDLVWMLRAKGLQVAGVFDLMSDARTAIERGLEVRLALVDLGLPDGSGLDLVRWLRQRATPPEVVVLTALSDDEHLFEALRRGACGYLLKSTSADGIAAGVCDALRGGAPMSPAIARRVVGSFGRDAATPLTPRETEVLELLVKGASYPQIGVTLGIAIGTVQEHIKKIYRKLEVATKAEAAVEAVRRRLVS